MNQNEKFRIWTEINRLKLQINTIAELFAAAVSESAPVPNGQSPADQHMVIPPHMRKGVS